MSAEPRVPFDGSGTMGEPMVRQPAEAGPGAHIQA